MDRRARPEARKVIAMTDDQAIIDLLFDLNGGKPGYPDWQIKRIARYRDEVLAQRRTANVVGQAEVSAFGELLERSAFPTYQIVREIATERFRQITEEGWTEEHDDKHSTGALARAAACYALPEDLRNQVLQARSVKRILEWIWPFSEGFWKPKDRRRDLVRAGALIVAEIERLERRLATVPNCSGCGRKMSVYHLCDRETDTRWCGSCFDDHVCGKGEHGEGCPGKVFDSDAAAVLSSLQMEDPGS